MYLHFLHQFFKSRIYHAYSSSDFAHFPVKISLSKNHIHSHVVGMRLVGGALGALVRKQQKGYLYSCSRPFPTDYIEE
jgi:hypothetical protein